jgi:hypothetical protein
VIRRPGTVLLAGLVLLLGLAGCYRSMAPAQIDETVRLEFTNNDGRYVRAQGYLSEELAKTLVLRTGWRVSPTGTATLSIALKEETIRGSDRNQDDILIGQRVRLHGTALLTTRHGSLVTPFSGETVITSPLQEPQALRGAALACATEVAEWLGVRAGELQRPQPAP